MNAIVERIAHFLKQYPPFNILTLEELKTVVLNIHVINLEKNKTLFQINDALHSSFYMVASGSINLTVISDSEETLLNKCVAGDVFGLRPFFAKNNYQMTAKAREDSIVYAIPIATFRPFVAKNEEVLNFLLESFANNTINPNDIENNGRLLSDNTVYSSKISEMQYFQSLSYSKTPFISNINVTAQEVAQHMSSNLIDYVIVSNNNTPVGIVTDSDLRSKIVTGRFELTIPVERIMSSPVITVSENVSLAEAQLLLLKNNVSHLCVTQDGSDKSQIKGIITQHDLIVAQASNPGVLIKEIKRSTDVASLKKIQLKLSTIIQKSISKNIPISHITNIAGEINDAIIKRSIELVILELGSPPARFAWLNIGSLGRKEQLLLTDQDSILIFEDVAADNYRNVKDYFIKLAKKVTSILESIGYKSGPNNHIASNPEYCKSLTEWTKKFNTWINTPGKDNEESCSIFFDYEIVYGNQEIEQTLTDFVFKNIYQNNLFFDYLGNDALRKPPPLSFFKKFNVEESGEFKDKFDVKTKAILPLVDCARLMVLSHNISGINNTFSRFKQLAMIDPKHSEIYLNCAEAFLYFSKIRTLDGLKNESTGQFINMDDLSKIEKEKFKNELNPIKEIEELIKDSYKLTKFS